MKYANAAVAEIHRAEFFRKGEPAREPVMGKRQLLLTRWLHPTASKRQQLNELFSFNSGVMKDYPLKDSPDRQYLCCKGQTGHFQLQKGGWRTCRIHRADGALLQKCCWLLRRRRQPR
jgi:hypothetical protein